MNTTPEPRSPGPLPSFPAEAFGDDAHLEVLLRRLAMRLTYAADGRTPSLDNALNEVRQHLRGSLTETTLTPLLADLTEAVCALDLPPPDSDTDVATTQAPDAAVDSAASATTATLVSLIDQLQLGNTAAETLAQLRIAIDAATDLQALAQQTEALANLINQHHRDFTGQRATAERLLTHVTQQLDELAQYLIGEESDHSDGNDARKELSRCLVGEISALGSSVQDVPDMATLQQEIRVRLNTITSHLKTFHEREDARELSWQERSNQMTQRIRELERATQSMEITLRQEHQLASTDPLTGIANRLTFEQRLIQACAAQALSSATDTCLLVLDIDHFKRINDQFGHAAGDRALRIVAEQLQSALRPEDLLARYGGEEFVVVLPTTSKETGMRIAERLREHIENVDFRCRQQPVQITLCCGLTALRNDDTPASAFDRADSALYRAKHRGGMLSRGESIGYTKNAGATLTKEQYDHWWERFTYAFDRLVPI
ncbi:MAG: diguanylate cyclase, partial [Rhodanobacter sp.]